MFCLFGCFFEQKPLFLNRMEQKTLGEVISLPETLLKSYSLTALTPLGTVSRLKTLSDTEKFDKITLLKGGSRAARARAIKLAAAQAQNSTLIVNADSQIPEAAILGNREIIDAAEPHPIEPNFPSAFEEVVWLGECYDNALLRQNRAEIIALTCQIKERTEQARRFLAAADALINDNRRIAREAADEEKIIQQAQRIAKNFSGGGFNETACVFSSSIFGGELQNQLKKPKTVVALQDELGCCSGVFLRELHRCLKIAGCEVVAGYSPFSPYERLEQLILPEQGVAFLLDNSRIKCPFEPDKVIHSRRFTDKEKLAACKSRIAFNKKAAQQMLQRAAQLYKEGEEFAGKLDAIYDSALNEQKFEAVCKRLG